MLNRSIVTKNTKIVNCKLTFVTADIYLIQSNKFSICSADLVCDPHVHEPDFQILVCAVGPVRRHVVKERSLGLEGHC